MQINSALVNFCDEAETAVNLNDLALDLPTQRKFKDNGAMIAPATIARTGIMEYTAGQCGALFADRDPNSKVRIMTEAVDLFDADSLDSYHSAPITIGHPTEDVTTENAKELQKGHLDGVPFADEKNGMLAANIVLSDSEAIDTVETGTSQLSSGHSCMLVMADESEDFDAKKTMIRANHVAIVAVGRAGVAEIADKDDDHNPTKVELADVQSKLTDAEEQVQKLTAELDNANELVESTKQKLADEKEKFADAVEKTVKSKLNFLAIATPLTDTNLVGMTEHDAKVLILKDTLGKDFSDKSKIYVEARFDSLLETLADEKEDDDNSIAAALAEDAKTKANLEDEKAPSKNQTARDKMIARNSNIK